jgi:hypothetical protein
LLFGAFSPVLFCFFVLISSPSIIAKTFALGFSLKHVILEGEFTSYKSCLCPKQLICN